MTATPAAERDARRVQDARLHTAMTGQAVEWRGTVPTPCFRSKANEWTIVPYYQRDGNGMLAVIEAMRAKGWWFEIVIVLSGEAQADAFQAGGPMNAVCEIADTAPEAVVAAAITALEQEGAK